VAELSLAAQAVMNACTDAPIHINWATRSAAAAVLRAAADQVVPAEDEDVYLVPWNFTEHMRQRQDSRRQLLAIAAELANTSRPRRDHL
jgi:hypothetical protein